MANDKINDKVAVYPGSFDPITNGHLDVIKRALSVFDKLIIAVSEKPEKKLFFTVEERIKMIKDAAKGLDVKVESFDALLTEYVKKKKIKFVVRGLRAVSDFDREFQMAIANHELNPDMETFFIMTDKKYFYLNSTLVKELVKYGGNIKEMVPKNVEKALKDKFVEQNP